MVASTRLHRVANLLQVQRSSFTEASSVQQTSVAQLGRPCSSIEQPLVDSNGQQPSHCMLVNTRHLGKRDSRPLWSHHYVRSNIGQLQLYPGPLRCQHVGPWFASRVRLVVLFSSRAVLCCVVLWCVVWCGDERGESGVGLHVACFLLFVVVVLLVAVVVVSWRCLAVVVVVCRCVFVSGVTWICWKTNNSGSICH